MAFKEKSEKELLKLSKEEQIKYWEDFKNYYTQKRKDVQKKIKEFENQENAKNKKKMNHARFVLFGEMIKHEGIKSFIQKMSQADNNFTKTDVEDINILMKYLNWNFEFKYFPKTTN